jgi:hypothetical protein
MAAAALKMLGRNIDESLFSQTSTIPLDVPDKGFTGPF